MPGMGNDTLLYAVFWLIWLVFPAGAYLATRRFIFGFRMIIAVAVGIAALWIAADLVATRAPPRQHAGAKQ
jgi:hypothetical protein